MDRRMQKTKNAIYQAFNKLLTLQPYSKITVQQIIDEANIGRSTFYAHYETKDELLKEMCQHIFSHVISTNLSEEKTHDFSTSNQNLTSILTHILYHIKEEVIHFKGFLNSENGEYFWMNFRCESVVFIKGHMLTKIRKPSVPENVLIHHISTTLEGQMKLWLQKGMMESPETIAKYIEALLGPYIQIHEECD